MAEAKFKTWGLLNMIQTTVYYGIDQSHLEKVKTLPPLEKFVFIVHNSIFLQLTAITIIVSLALLIVHHKVKAIQHENITKLIAKNSDLTSQEHIKDKISNNENKSKYILLQFINSKL